MEDDKYRTIVKEVSAEEVENVVYGLEKAPEKLKSSGVLQKHPTRKRRKPSLFKLLLNFICVFAVYLLEELPARLFYSKRPLDEAPSIIKNFGESRNLFKPLKCGSSLAEQSKSIRDGIQGTVHCSVAEKDEGGLFCELINTSYMEQYGKTRLSLQQYADLFTEGHVAGFVVEGGKKVGTFVFFLAGNGSAEFSCLSIAKKFRGRGLMSKVISELADVILGENLVSGIFFDAVPLLGRIYTRVLNRKWTCLKVPGVRMANPANVDALLLLYGVFPELYTTYHNVDAKEPDMTNAVYSTLRHSVGVEHKSSRVCIVAFLLGSLFAAALTLAWTSARFFNLGWYVMFSVLWHVSEFLFEDCFHNARADVSSFILDSKAYMMGTSLMIVEYFIENFFGVLQPTPPRAAAGGVNLKTVVVALACCGLLFSLCVQITAKVTLGRSFTYFVAGADEKRDDMLKTDGLYAISRHPRYAAFLFWVLCLNLVLLNPVNLVLQLFMTFKFYKMRIQKEEEELEKAYGEQYTAYKNRVGTFIPFIA